MASKFDPKFYVLAYEYARAGLRNQEIARALGLSGPVVANWKKKDPVFAFALKKGRAFHDGKGTETFIHYVYNRLPPELQEVWEKIQEWEDAPNGTKRIEAMLQRNGLRARQHLFLYALTSSNFNIQQACRSLNITRRCFEQWCIHDPKFKALMGEIHQYKKDFYENALIRSVMDGETAAVIFANKTFNRDRGYNDKQEIQVTGTPGGNFIDISTLNLSIEVKRAIMEAVRKQKEGQKASTDEEEEED